MASKNTKTMRVYKADIEEIRMRFGNVRTADFFRMAVRTNPFLQIEANLRKKNKNEKDVCK